MATTDEAVEASGDLEVSVEEGKAVSRRLSVTVPADRVRAARERERKELGQAVRLDGFRPGKVPAQVIEERYGPVVRDRTVQSVVDAAFREAVREADLTPVGQPEITDVRYEEGGELSFRAEVEVRPEPELERTGGFRITRPDAEVSEEDVDEIVERIREDHAVWEPVDRAPAEGDQVSVRIWHEEDEEEGEREPYRFELGAGYAIPDVEEAIRSLEPGRSGEFEISFPDDFGDDELAGSTRRLQVELLTVKEKGLPELEDAFASEIGDFETIQDLREAVREDLRGHREEEAEESVRRDLLDAIVEANPFDVPETMVERYLERVMDVPEDADPEKVAEARRSLYPRAEQEIKRQLVMDRLVQLRGFEATEEELEARLEEIADRRGSEPRRVRRRLERESRLEGVRRHIAAEKLFEDLKTESTIKSG